MSQTYCTIARNILLLSWLIDEKPIEDTYLWTAYYSVIIDAGCFQAIHERSELLVTISSTLSEWHRSRYGRILRVIDSETLFKVRQFWVKYCGLADMTNKLNRIRDRFMTDFRQIREKRAGVSLSGMRSFGAISMIAAELVIEIFQRFWDTGVVSGLPELTKGATYINPLFVYSNIGGEQCVIHYGTDPIMGFHCAVALMETTHSPILHSLGPYNQNATLEEKVHRVARAAILEFKSWCAVFHSIASQTQREPGLLRIHSFAGDALEFCYSLQTALGKIEPADNFFQTCAAPWNRVLELNSNTNLAGPFDIIDTSNLADHVGLLNILVCALPLLKCASNAVLYTENLAQKSDECSPLERLKSLLCGNPSSIFCLLRAAPMECLTGFSTSCSLHEDATFHFTLAKGLSTQLRWRFSWKDIVLGDQHVTAVNRTLSFPSWDIDSLARTTISIYNEMFKEEYFSSILPSASKNHILPKHYTRASFVALLKLIQLRHHIDNWSEFFNIVIEFISKDNPVSLHSQWTQEFLLQLHLQRLHTWHILHEALKSSAIYIHESWPDNIRQFSLPLTIPILFRIPREQCQHILKEFNAVNATSDIVLRVSVSCLPVINDYSVMTVAFADRITDGSIPPSWASSRDLIVYVHLPAWTLLMESRKANEISLRLQYDLPAIHQFLHLLGPDLVIFKTSVWNTEYVIPKFTQEFEPVVPKEPSIAAGISGSGPDFCASAPKLGIVDGQTAARIRINVTGHLKTKLATIDKIDSGQDSPCTFRVNLGNTAMEIALPFPSQHRASRILVARKSGWIEVIAPFITNSSGSSFNFTKFPVMKDDMGKYYSWNMPRLSIELLPQLKFSTNAGLNWINMNIGSSFSLRERSIREKHINDLSSGDPLVDLKENIFSLFMRGTGIQRHRETGFEHPPKVFFLRVHEAGIMSIIFLIGIRLEPNDSTLVADSYVFPLNPILVSTFSKELSLLSEMGGIVLRCSVNSYKLWTLYIRASVERSRSWSHRSSCAGKLQDGMVDHLQQFLCQCGAGNVTKEFEEVSEWKSFTPFVTRCLFTPLFPVQCMEPIMTMTMDFDKFGTSKKVKVERELDTQKSCFTCKAKEAVGGGKLLHCTRCRSTVYCSKECQKKDWKQHKLNCRC